jgi:hypothetical protein
MTSRGATCRENLHEWPAGLYQRKPSAFTAVTEEQRLTESGHFCMTLHSECLCPSDTQQAFHSITLAVPTTSTRAVCTHNRSVPTQYVTLACPGRLPAPRKGLALP